MFFMVWLVAGEGGRLPPPPNLISNKKSLSLLTWWGWGQVNLRSNPHHCPSLHILNGSHSILNFSGIWF